MDRVLITGASGQLGSDLSSLFANSGVKTTSMSKDSLNVTNMREIREVVERENPNWIVNCAAFTDLDYAEEDKNQALDVNFKGSKNLAKVCASSEIGLIHISTDALFSSEVPVYFKTKDPPNPMNVYGYSKQLGEEAIREITERYWILRSSWIYGLKGSRFFNSVLDAVRNSRGMEVVNNQFGQPTPTSFIHHAILKILKNEVEVGVHHVVPKEFLSRFEFAIEIKDAYERVSRRKSKSQITPKESIANSGAAPRPKYSLLEPSQIISDLKDPKGAISNQIYDVVRLREDLG